MNSPSLTAFGRGEVGGFEALAAFVVPGRIVERGGLDFPSIGRPWQDLGQVWASGLSSLDPSACVATWLEHFHIVAALVPANYVVMRAAVVRRTLLAFGW